MPPSLFSFFKLSIRLGNVLCNLTVIFMNLSSSFFSIRKEGSIQIWREVWWGLWGGWDDDLKENGQVGREVALSRSILDVNTKADASLPDTEGEA